MNMTDMMTYGLAIRHAIGQKLSVDGLNFTRIEGTNQYDAVHTGQNSDVFEMEGTGKQYRITITPLMETHSPQYIEQVERRIALLRSALKNLYWRTTRLITDSKSSREWDQLYVARRDVEAALKGE